MARTVLAVAILTLAVAACSDPEPAGDTVPPPDAAPESPLGYEYPPAPDVPDGPVDPELAADVSAMAGDLVSGTFTQETVEAIGASGDPRLAWYLSDLMRFFSSGSEAIVLLGAFEEVTGVDLREDPDNRLWPAATNLLIAWDLPAFEGYVEAKRQLLTIIDPRWEVFFDEAVSVDWRLVSWGGVLMDDRPAGASEPCARGCIPALDDPALVPANTEGDWYADDGIVFGVAIGDEAVAFPKNIMEVHEMVNITVGDRRLGIPYCTLCGSAQAYLLDEHDRELVLRTSGLLSRSNKMMFDLGTMSLIDTFTGEATSGPLAREGVRLSQTTVVASEWGAWKEAHPDTSIVAEDGGIGRDYPADPLQGRDDDGPIFPVGDVDPRLDVQEPVVGVVAPDGTPVAFPVQATRAALEEGERVAVGGVEVALEGSGLSASVDGDPVASHQAFWFAWSQFHPDTAVWERGEG